MDAYAHAVNLMCKNAEQVGFLRGGIKTAILALELGNPDRALAYLADTLDAHEVAQLAVKHGGQG